MKKWLKEVLIILLALFIFTGQVFVFADSYELEDVIHDTVEYIQHRVQKPQVSPVGGEWSIIGLARSHVNIADKYFDDYYRTVKKQLRDTNGLLHDKKYTEYSRVILGLTAAGYDPTDVAAYDLTKALADYEKTVWQGINGPIYGLIALDCHAYTIPTNSQARLQASRDMYVDEIIGRQLPDGGFSLLELGDQAHTSYKSDPDITAMVLQALARYQDREDVAKITEEALNCLSNLQNDKGGYDSLNGRNSESVAQVIVALGELGIPLNDPRFVKDGNTLLDNLMTFYTRGRGFSHSNNGESNLMATEQALYALVAAQRAKAGKNSLYNMMDVDIVKPSDKSDKITGEGLPGKNLDVKAMPLLYPGRTFNDIENHRSKLFIEALAERSIVSGRSQNTFDADGVMTRAEFATIVVKGLGLEGKANHVFDDIPRDSWYADMVGGAHSYGIVSGVSANSFQPLATISREEAAVMISKAGKLAGMDISMTDDEIRDILAQFPDYMASSTWARPSLAFCYREGILSQEDSKIRPKDPIKRHELVEMLYFILEAANLL